MGFTGAIKRELKDICDLFVIETLSTPEGKVHRLSEPREICINCKKYELSGKISYCKKDAVANTDNYSEDYKKSTSS